MKNKNLILCGLMVVSFFVYTDTCNASTIFTENFNSYSNGYLAGQDLWTGAAGNGEFAVQDGVVHEGSKAIKITGFGDSRTVQKIGTPVNDGQVTFYVKGNGLGNFEINLQEGSTVVTQIGFNFLGNGKITYINNASYVVIADVPINAWFPLQAQWRSSDHNIRFNVNGGTWTDWDKVPAVWNSGIDTIKMFESMNFNSGGEWYLDSIQENPDNARNPVLIVPGILGSAQQNGKWVIDPILHTYDNLIDTFKANGYVQDETLFEIPYDWHKSNVDTAIELKIKIDQIKDICDCSKVDLIGHSMGGLVARQYIESNNYQDDIDKLIFLGTPHLGAPKDYLTWEAGETDKDIQDQLVKFVFSREAKKQGYDSLFDYIRNKPIPSVQELLPIYNYLVDSSPLSVRHYPVNYPINSFLENLNNNLSDLNNSGVTVYNIIGDSQDNSTINFIRLVPSTKLPLWEDGYPDGFNENASDRGLALGGGDGTVPVISSNIFPDTVLIKSDHAGLPTNAESQILDDILGQGEHTIINNSYGPNYRILIIKLLSPIDMQVVAPDGKRIGKDFSTNQEINEISDAFYSGFQTDDEYVTILNPEDGQYKIVTEGTDNGGEYTVSSALISDTQDMEHDFQGHAITGQIDNLNLNISSGDDEIDITPEDTAAPEITVTSPQDQDYLHSDDININYSVTDNNSGVFSSSAKLDTISVDKNQNIDAFYQSLGNHSLVVQAQDNVNNQTSVSVQFRIIATVESTIDDINKAYALGWINKKSVRDDLIKKIEKATKLITKIQYLEKKAVGKPRILKKIQITEKKLDTVLAKAILLDLKMLKKDIISQSASDVISADVNWLIDN